MRHNKLLLRLISIAIWCLFGPQSFADVPSRVSEVTVFSNGALVTRTADVALNSGDSEIIFSGLPQYLEIDNLKVEVTNVDAYLGQVRLRTEPLRDDPDPQVMSLNKQLDSLNYNMSEVMDRIKTAKLQLKFLDSLSQGFAKESWIQSSQARTNVGGWREALSLMQTGSASAYASIRENNRLSDEIQKDITLVKRKLKQRNSNRKSLSSISVSFGAERSLNTQVKLIYFQEDASWAPIYEARLNSETGRLRLTQKAMIRQETEELWDNVKLTLSTSEPNEELSSRELESNFVDFTDNRQYSMSGSSGEGLEEVIVTAMKKQSSWVGSYSLSYQVPGLLNVANGYDEGLSVDVENYEFDTDLVTKVVPQYDSGAYLTARFTHLGKTPLYGNSISVYVDGVLMGETDMPTILPGAEVALPMGKDRRVNVEILDQGGVDSQSGIVKKQRQEVTNLIYKITNRRAKEVEVEVLAARPVSTNRAIKVHIDKSSTNPDVTDLDKKKGVVMWRKKLMPSQSWEIIDNYKISFPADRDITGY